MASLQQIQSRRKAVKNVGQITKAMVKRFKEWIILKEKLHENTYKPPLFKESEMWWCGLGENIGHEINGKSEYFSRPVVILKKLSSRTFLCVPTSTQIRNGTWYIEFNLHGIVSIAILSQIRILDYKRLYNKIGQLSLADFKKIRIGFKKLFVSK